MSGFKQEVPDRNAAAADCARLWSTLTGEYIPGLRILLEPRFDEFGRGAIWVAVVDDSAIAVNGSQLENIWAERVFLNQLHLISLGQLFALLIDAYRKIDEYFRIGEASAPTRRAK